MQTMSGLGVDIINLSVMGKFWILRLKNYVFAMRMPGWLTIMKLRDPGFPAGYTS